MAIETDALITDRIESDPARAGIAEARLRESAAPIWTLVAYWKATGENDAQVARDYQIAPADVAAALAYYRRHKALIDERIQANRA
jgi:uncharacterized protein (DUF433 family)